MMSGHSETYTNDICQISQQRRKQLIWYLDTIVELSHNLFTGIGV